MNQNPTNKLSSRDQTDLERYIRFLVLKMSQVIVQSRFGEKRTCQTKISSSHDWFNLAIEDNEEIQAKAKEAYSSVAPLKDFCMCTEILLKTADGDTLILETWSLRLDTKDALRDSPYVSYTSLSSVYCRMALLLKSIIAVTRVTPSYKLSSRQSADTYVILFRIYNGEPQVHQLGEGYQENKIGEVLTPVGSVKMSVAYRTKMTITPQKVEKESPFMVKSDYFKPDMSPKRLCPIGLRPFPVDKKPPEETNTLPEGFVYNHSNVPLSNGHCAKRMFPLNSLPDDERGIFGGGLVNGDSKKSCLNCQISPNDYRNVGAFAPSTNLPDTTLFPELALLEKPFLNLSRSTKLKPPSSEKQQQQQQPPAQGGGEDDNNRRKPPNNNNNLNEVDNKRNSGCEEGEVDYNCNANEKCCPKLTSSDSSDCGDFVMVELKPPFAGCDSDNDLGAFFRECQCAPPLVSFASQPTLEEQVIDIASQLAKFETSMNDFDNFVDSICHVEAEK